MKIPALALSLTVMSTGTANASESRGGIHKNSRFEPLKMQAKCEIKKTRPRADRQGGLVQITGKDLYPGQVVFPHRTPTDPVPFYDRKTGELLVYGTQVDGAGFSYLAYEKADDLLRGAPFKQVNVDVFLPNGQLAQGKEAVWDTYRLSYEDLLKVFHLPLLEQIYRLMGLDPGSDLHYGGIALQENGALGRWTADNWRRRVHAIGSAKGRLRILENPVFNPIAKGKTEFDYPGLGHLPFLPGDYIGHAYGPNFKLVPNGDQLQLWIISEEVTRRVNETGVPAEVTEIVARKMISPFEASQRPEDRVLLLSVNGPDGKPHIDSDRGKEMAHTKLIEGFRPMSLSPGGLRITQRAVQKNGEIVDVEDPSIAEGDYFLMTGSSGNFAGDDYDARVAYRKDSAIGAYQMMYDSDGKSWKGFLKELKKKYRLSWAGRGSFVQHEDGGWWLLFHAADKDLKPDGSYGGVIPPNTHEYHRNLYAIPVEFFVNLEGKPDMRVLL